jgi:hypothetical protein
LSTAAHGRGERARLRRLYEAHARTRDAETWFALLAPPLAWLVAESAGYALVPWVCHGGPEVVLHAVTIGAMAATVAGGLCGWAARSDPGGDAGIASSDPREPSDRRRRFLATVAMLGSALFFLVLAGQEIANFVLGPCHA